MWKRDQIAALILERLCASANEISRAFQHNGKIQHAWIDDLLPVDVANEIAGAFPSSTRMKEHKSVREHKFTAKQLNEFPAILEEATFAFQDPRVVERLQTLTGLVQMTGDPCLYAGGISMMERNNFLLPHLDNSHDRERNRYRVLNLLYYVTPGWRQEDGGNLELWEDGTGRPPREIVSTFNRLVVMATHQKSWHSVNRVTSDRGRACISNYYFAERPVTSGAYFHVTSFRGRPEQRVRDLMLRVDSRLRNTLRRAFRTGLFKSEIYESSKG